MTKYEQLINKIRTIKNLKDLKEFSNHQNPCPNCNFSEEELKIMADALETIQSLEIIFKERNMEHYQKQKESQENHV
jgi:hypothetical protein